MATETGLTFSDGARRPNGGPAIYLTGARLSVAREFPAFDDAYDGKIGEGPIEDQRPKFVAVKSSADDALLKTYIKHKGITGYREREAREMWRIFRTVVNKPLRECTRDDGRHGRIRTSAWRNENPPRDSLGRTRRLPLIQEICARVFGSRRLS